MPSLFMRADKNKMNVSHHMIAASAFPMLDHLSKHAPSGAFVDVPSDLPAGQYTFSLQKDNATGHVEIVLTPGTVK